MSTPWIVSTVHIDLLVTAMRAWGLIRADQATETGRLLWRTNLASVAYFYPNDRDGERPGPADFRDDDVEEYEFRACPGRIDPQVVSIAAESYDYQSSDHPDYNQSEILGLLSELARLAMDRLPEHEQRFGYINPDDLKWSPKVSAWDVSRRDAFVQAGQLRLDKGRPVPRPIALKGARRLR